jgi:uncharacterized protein
MNTIGYFEIQANEPETAIKFYEAVFGWNFIEELGFPIRYWRIETDSMNGGLLERPARTPPTECGTNAFTCSIRVEDFDRIADLIEKNGGQVALPKFEIPGRCWQGYFIDPDHNTFGIFEVTE